MTNSTKNISWSLQIRFTCTGKYSPHWSINCTNYFRTHDETQKRYSLLNGSLLPPTKGLNFTFFTSKVDDD